MLVFECMKNWNSSTFHYFANSGKDKLLKICTWYKSVSSMLALNTWPPANGKRKMWLRFGPLSAFISWKDKMHKLLQNCILAQWNICNLLSFQWKSMDIEFITLKFPQRFHMFNDTQCVTYLCIDAETEHDLHC